jgi:D-sedoheptulose 7-phosphate isomerase/D-glycero-D-manno-heptose 1,7-bisphosphate phosphatase
LPARAGILLDRDGTIIVDHGYVDSVDRVEFIDGSPEAIASFSRTGIPVAVVTNQAGVARGLYGIDDVARVDRLAEYGAQIDLFAYLPLREVDKRNRSHFPGPSMKPGCVGGSDA